MLAVYLFLRVSGGTPLLSRDGGFAPLPTPVGLWFVMVLGPARGPIANAGGLPLLKNLGGHPHSPGRGLCPLHPYFSPTLVG